jgi:hypothetical protein
MMETRNKENPDEDPPSSSSSFTEDEHLGKKKKRTWTVQVEKLLADWGDVALCYTWLHDKSYRKYNMLNYKYSIPIIVLSTLTGTANFGLHGIVPLEYSQYAQIVIGFTSLMTGVLGTLQSFFRHAQRSESHANALRGWSKLYRNISIELSLERSQRKNADDVLKASKTEYDRLVENSPSIPSDVIAKFMEKFKHSSDFNLPYEVSTNLSHTFVFNEKKRSPPLLEVFKDVVKKRGQSPPHTTLSSDIPMYANTGNILDNTMIIDMNKSL